MPIAFLNDRAVFGGRCAPEEADTLLDWLRRTPGGAVDLGGCPDLHTALAQVLLAARPRMLVAPPDPLLAACLGAGSAPGDAPPAAEAAPAAPVPPPARRGRGRRGAKPDAPNKVKP
jgi:hypothetical protein